MAEGKKEVKKKEAKMKEKPKKAEQKKEKKKGFLKRITGKKEEKKPVQPAAMTDVEETEPFRILRFVLMTEKAVRMIELQNKLVFIVDRKSTKKQIKAAAESAFQSPIVSVNTEIDQKGRKKAFIKFREPGQAGEIAIRLGII